jgi:hypothetical protein
MPFHVTIMISTYADGSYVPPYVIHSSGADPANIKLYEKDFNFIKEVGAGLNKTPNGSMTKAIFPDACNHIISDVNKRRKKRGNLTETYFLFVDGHSR